MMGCPWEPNLGPKYACIRDGIWPVHTLRGERRSLHCVFAPKMGELCTKNGELCAHFALKPMNFARFHRWFQTVSGGFVPKFPRATHVTFSSRLSSHSSSYRAFFRRVFSFRRSFFIACFHYVASFHRAFSFCRPFCFDFASHRPILLRFASGRKTDNFASILLRKVWTGQGPAPTHSGYSAEQSSSHREQMISSGGS